MADADLKKYKTKVSEPFQFQVDIHHQKCSKQILNLHQKNMVQCEMHEVYHLKIRIRNFLEINHCFRIIVKI